MKRYIKTCLKLHVYISQSRYNYCQHLPHWYISFPVQMHKGLHAGFGHRNFLTFKDVALRTLE